VNETAVVVRIALLLLRPGMLLGTTSPFGSSFAPAPVKIGLIVLISLVLMPVVALPQTLTPGMITLIAARESMIGLALAFSVRLVLGGVELAGQLAGFQLGFSYASLIDPQSGARNSVMSATYGLMALFVFLAIDAHHEMLRALAASYDAMPVGAWHFEGNITLLIAHMLGMVFTVGLQLAAPVVLVLMIVELALGLMARTMPSLNLMVTGAPVRLIVGLIAVAATLQVLPSVVTAAVKPALELAVRFASAFK
jgi:flagellar biosynthetic protein FliR